MCLLPLHGLVQREKKPCKGWEFCLDNWWNWGSSCGVYWIVPVVLQSPIFGSYLEEIIFLKKFLFFYLHCFERVWKQLFPCLFMLKYTYPEASWMLQYFTAFSTDQKGSSCFQAVYSPRNFCYSSPFIFDSLANSNGQTIIFLLPELRGNYLLHKDVKFNFLLLFCCLVLSQAS